MLYLLFSVGERRYCIEAKKVLRVLDKVSVKPVSEAPAFVKGLIQFEQQWIPVLDLCELAVGRSSLNNMSTRMILIDYPTEENNHTRLALIAEAVDDTINLDPEQFGDTGLKLNEYQFFGDLAVEDSDVIQMIKPENLLTTAAMDILSPQLNQQAG